MQADTIESLKDRIEQLEAILGSAHLDPLRLMGFQPQQAAILGMLLEREVVSTDKMCAYLWPTDEPEFSESIIKLRVWQIRGKLKQLGISPSVRSVWGVGYTLWPGVKDKINDKIRVRFSDVERGL